MLTKADRTTQFITEQVAPVFNKKGYAGTSLSDITTATGLTKGAVYGNFDNKEALYLQCFDYLCGLIMAQLEAGLEQGSDPIQNLDQFIRFYKDYHAFTTAFGGCPLVNFGTDSAHTHPEMKARVQKVMHQIESRLSDIIEAGRSRGLIRKAIHGPVYARRFYALIQGAVFMSQTTDDPSYLEDAMNVITDTINQRFKS